MSERKWQIIVDIDPGDSQSGKEPTADAIAEFVCDYLGGPDRALPARNVRTWWTREPIEGGSQ